MEFRTIILCETIKLFSLFLYLVKNSKNISISTKLAIIAGPYLLSVFP